MTDASLAGASRAGSRPGGSGATGSGPAVMSPAPPGARAAALAWLAHPASLAGIALLLLNDHLLKAAFGTWWTGKLSDVAGLVFAPALVAVAASLLAPRARPASLARGAIVGVGITFALVKATAFGAAASSAAWSTVTEPAFGTASVVRHDPTDLLALPALALAWWAFARAGTAREPGRRTRTLRAAIVIPVAVFSVAATSTGGHAHATDVSIHDRFVFIGVSDSGGDYGGDVDAEYFVGWYRSELTQPTPDDARWPELSMETARDDSVLNDPGATRQTEACLPSTPMECYRIVPGQLGVERTTDAGTTWALDWGVPEDERDKLLGKGPGIDDPVADFSSTAIAAGDVTGHEYVVVVNGVDGIAIRDATGTWWRLPVPGSAPDEVR